jgi:hypothetical protein
MIESRCWQKKLSLGKRDNPKNIEKDCLFYFVSQTYMPYEKAMPKLLSTTELQNTEMGNT